MSRATPMPHSLSPDGAAQQRKPDSALIKALARAYLWKRMVVSGNFATIGELAEREGIAPSYLTRVMRLTLLAPDKVEAIWEGLQGADVTLAQLLEQFTAAWAEQQAKPEI